KISQRGIESRSLHTSKRKRRIVQARTAGEGTRPRMGDQDASTPGNRREISGDGFYVVKKQPLSPSQRNEPHPPMRGKAASPPSHAKISHHQPCNNRRCNPNSKLHHAPSS